MNTHPVARYIPLLIAGDLDGLLALFEGAPHVNDPRLGWVESGAFDLFVANSHQGLMERSATVQHVATVITPTGAVEECLLSLIRRGVLVTLPVAIAADLAGDALIGSLRVYHSTWPLVGWHLLRGPVLAAVEGLVLPEVVRSYHDCLDRGDVAGIVALFAPDGTLRDPGGGPKVHRGARALHAYFDVLFSQGGGLRVEHCTVADDGASCALEYNFVAHGGRAFSPQAGAAVYARAETGLLSDVRRYDDLEVSTPAS